MVGFLWVVGFLMEQNSSKRLFPTRCHCHSCVGIWRSWGAWVLVLGTQADCGKHAGQQLPCLLRQFCYRAAACGLWVSMTYAVCCAVHRITKPFAALTIGILVAQAVSGPVAAAFLFMDGLCGMRGWQWLFLLEGLPTVLLSAVVWFCLPESPACSPWLNENDKKILAADVSGYGALQGSL